MIVEDHKSPELRNYIYSMFYNYTMDHVITNIHYLAHLEDIKAYEDNMTLFNLNKTLSFCSCLDQLNLIRVKQGEPELFGNDAEMISHTCNKDQYAYTINNNKLCDCGALKVRHSAHSSWCSTNEKEPS